MKEQISKSKVKQVNGGVSDAPSSTLDELSPLCLLEFWSSAAQGDLHMWSSSLSGNTESKTGQFVIYYRTPPVYSSIFLY